MKIKYDFVTNSSSVAYIVMVPDNFHPSENEMREEYEHRDIYDDFHPTLEEATKEMHECLTILRNGDNIWNYGHDGVNQTVYYMLLEICDEHGFVLGSIDISSEGNNIIQGVKEEVIEKLITNNIDILSIFKLIQRETESDTSKTEQS